MADRVCEFDIPRICRETGVRRVELRNELPSTNDLALTLSGDAPETDFPLLVLAVRQTGGRGRGEHRWWSADGALTFSLVIDTIAWKLEPRRWPRISLATGIAVAQTVLDQLPSREGASDQTNGASPTMRDATLKSRNVRAKWPNDIFVNGRKICGILTENVARQPHRLVIGIGLNVNNSWRDAPTELQAIGTSLIDVTQRSVSPTDILIALLQRLEQTLAGVANDEFLLSETWRTFCMLEGHTVTVEAGNRHITGTCHGIDDDGALLLHNENGIQRCVAGTIIRIQ